LLREIGRGGMGLVFEAVQEGLGRQVAVKIMRGAATLSPLAVRRFHREAEAIARLHHPHIIPVYSVGEQDGIHYYAMEFVEGVSLEGVLRRLRRLGAGAADPFDPRSYTTAGAEEGPASAKTTAPTHRTRRSRGGFAPTRQYINTAVEVIVQAAEALHCAHAHGIVHRDVKPANLLLTMPRTVVLSDFGLAHWEGAEGLTVTGAIFGTPMYMSPEQARGSPVVIDHRTDIWSLGVTLYELVTLRPPWRSSEPAAVIEELQRQDPRTFRQLGVRLPRDLEVIIFKAMEKRPERRYQTAQDFADDLRRFLNYQPIQARRPGPLVRAGKFLRRHQTTAAVIAAAALTAFVLATGLTWRWSRSQAQALARIVDEGYAELAQARAAGDERAADDHFEQAKQRFSAALALDRDNPRATDGLSEVYLTRCGHALDRQAYDVARGMLIPLKELDRRGAHAAQIEEYERRAAGTATWTLETTPPGCRVSLARLDDDGQPGPYQNLGATPLPAQPIAMGSYLMLLSHADHTLVRYPLLIERNETRDVKVTLVRKDQVPPGMVYVPAGEFLFGDPEAGTQRKVNLAGYFIDRTEVTGADYEKFVKATGAQPPHSWNGSNVCPPALRGCAVYGVSWFEAQEYALWAGKRLPTDQEWEKAARGADGRRYPWGNRFERRRCTWRDSGVREEGLVVGRWPQGASPYGCLDMAGNVWEWTADRERPFDAYRVIRGGAAPDSPDELITYRRRGQPPAGSDYGALAYIGFRCARSLTPEPLRKVLDGLEYRSDLVQAITVYGGQGRLDVVLACADRMLQLNPQSVPGHNWRSIWLTEQKRYAEALAALRFVYLRSPNPDDVRDRVDQLIGELEKAGQKVDKGFLAAGDLFARAHEALARRRYPEAEEALKKLVALDPEHPIAHEGLGDVCAATGRPEEAARHYEFRAGDYRRLLKEEPGRAATHHEFARFLLQKNLHPEEGLAEARLAAERAPDDPTYLDLLAEFLFRTGRPAEAAAREREAVELARDKRFYQEQLRRYEKALEQKAGP
jgi:serine/threonine protein kinase/formylglycine-generating enzyme required for sulfatase activity/Flp pilus assembly protein TadD